MVESKSPRRSGSRLQGGTRSLRFEVIMIRSILLLARWASLLLVTGGLALAQTTWIVDSLQRPGFQFTDLPAAVAAAAPGDRIFLRYASADPLLGYTAATIQGKGVIIQGEVGAGLPAVYVVGGWNLSGVPAGQSIVMRDLSLRGVSSGTPRGFRWSATACAGSLVFERVRFGPENQSFVNILGPSDSPWTDCSLVAFRDCVLNIGNYRWNLLRTVMTMTNCALSQLAYIRIGLGGTIYETMMLDSSQLILTSSTVEGGNSYVSSQTGFVRGGSHAIHLRNSSTIVMGAGSAILGGTDGFGGRVRWTWEENLATAPSTLWRDASCQLVGFQFQQCCPLEYIQPQTGIVPTESPGQIQIQQFTEPSAPTILLLAPLQTTPWNFVIGPVFLDPSNLWSDLAVAPASGLLTRTLAIPPTIPPGQWVGAQAFSLDSTGRIMASNVTTVGVW